VKLSHLGALGKGRVLKKKKKRDLHCREKGKRRTLTRFEKGRGLGYQEEEGAEKSVSRAGNFNIEPVNVERHKRASKTKEKKGKKNAAPTHSKSLRGKVRKPVPRA